MVEYKVQFEVFEGPLDLLLYLVKKEEVDIYQVNLTRLATQFIEYVELMQELDIDIAGEFLVMAATLMLIKSRELLPRDQRPATTTEDDDTEDPRWELIRKLVEYKKFKDAAARLQEFERRQEQTFPRQAPKLDFPAPPTRTDVSLFDLISAVSAILNRFQARPDTRDIFEDKWTVSEKIEHLRSHLDAGRRFRFSDLFGEATSRTEVVVTFLALLELIRLRWARATQDEVFGEIAIESAPAAARETPPSAASPSPPPPAAALTPDVAPERPTVPSPPA
jgi:segregation and condensation protein A